MKQKDVNKKALAQKMAVNVHTQLRKVLGLSDEGLTDFLEENKIEIEFMPLADIAVDFIIPPLVQKKTVQWKDEWKAKPSDRAWQRNGYVDGELRFMHYCLWATAQWPVRCYFEDVLTGKIIQDVDGFARANKIADDTANGN